MTVVAALVPLYALWCTSGGGTILHGAASSGDVAKVKAMVGVVDPDRRDHLGSTPLTLAVDNGHYEAVRILLENGASPNRKRGTWPFGSGDSPLMLAARTERRAIFDLLLEHGADAGGRAGWFGDTVLMRAARSGDVDMLRELLDHGASVRTRRGGADALMLTCYSKRPEDLQVEKAAVLIEHGSRVDVVDHQGNTALSQAARQGWPRMVELLAAAGADVDHEHPKGWWPLLHAARRGHVATMEVLLAHGAKPLHEGYDPADVIGMAATLEAADLLRRAIDEQLRVESR